MARIEHDKEFDVFDVEPLCLLIGSQNVSNNLDPKFLGFIIEKLITSIDVGSKVFTIEHISKLYIALSRVKEVYVNSDEAGSM